VLEQLSSLFTTISNIIGSMRPHLQPAVAEPVASASPGPHGNNFTDSFLVQWRACRRERASARARDAYV
jgi:hypothetical protein